MRAKDYLNQAWVLERKIEHRKEEVEELKEKATSIAASVDSGGRVQTSPAADGRTRIVDRYVDLEREIEEMMLSLYELRDEIISTIHALEDRRFMEILYLKYIKHMRLEEIACRMKKANGQPYSYMHIVDLHGKALRAIEEILEEREVIGESYGNPKS